MSDYLITWHTDWVRRFGIDGFRADTVKHLEPEVWAKLKQAGTAALKEWKAANSAKLDDLPFYMVGEVWDHRVAKDFWYRHGFDSLINFDYQREFALPQAQCLASAEPTYASYASRINQDPEFNVLSYISSTTPSCSSATIRTCRCSAGSPAASCCCRAASDLLRR